MDKKVPVNAETIPIKDARHNMIPKRCEKARAKMAGAIIIPLTNMIPHALDPITTEKESRINKKNFKDLKLIDWELKNTGSKAPQAICRK